MSRQNDIKKLIKNHERRLQKLKEQQALEGIDIDPKILIQIEDIQEEIQNLQIELEMLPAQKSITRDTSSMNNRPSTTKNKPQFINPFIDGPPVPPKKFIGREREIDMILDRLINPSNRGGSMVSGPSGIGKTSLLHYLHAEETRKPCNLNPETAHCIYIPTHLISPFSEIDFWEFLFDGLEEWLGSNVGMEKILQSLAEETPPSRSRVSRFFNNLGQKDKFVIVLLDGFDLLMQEINRQDPEAGLGFLHTLRALLNLPAPRGFSLITSSERELFDLFQDVAWFGSGFYSNMANLPLAPFSGIQIDELIDSYLEGTGILFNNNDRQILKDTSSGHPKKLQHAAYNLFEAKIREINVEPTPETNTDINTQHELNIDSSSFDVFLAHNSQDKPQVQELALKLRESGLNPWLDIEQIPPGRWFQDVLQQAIGQVKSAAIFIGPTGLGKWQAVELKTFISQCVDKEIPVIPVLLPGIDDIPEELPFLRQLNLVNFKETIEDLEVLNRLIWGITGKKP